MTITTGDETGVLSMYQQWKTPQTWFSYADAKAEHQLPHDDSCNLMLYQCRH